MQFTYSKAFKIDAVLFYFIKIFLSMPLERVTYRLRRLRLTLEYS
jgi:hypothetical protein